MIVKSSRRYQGFGFGDIPLIPGVIFKNDDAYNDFIRGLPLHGPAGSWGGVSASTLKSLSDAVSAAEGPKASAMVETFITRAQKLVSNVTSLQPWTNIIMGRSDAQDMQYKNAMASLKEAIISYTGKINAAIRQDEADAAATPEATYPSTSQTKYTASSAALATAAGGGGILDIAVLGIPVVIIAPVVLALGVGLVMVLKPRRAAPVAGYRLRRARRSR